MSFQLRGCDNNSSPKISEPEEILSLHNQKVQERFRRRRDENAIKLTVLVIITFCVMYIMSTVFTSRVESRLTERQKLEKNAYGRPLKDETVEKIEACVSSFNATTDQKIKLTLARVVNTLAQDETVIPNAEVQKYYSSEELDRYERIQFVYSFFKKTENAAALQDIRNGDLETVADAAAIIVEYSQKQRTRSDTIANR